MYVCDDYALLRRMCQLHIADLNTDGRIVTGNGIDAGSRNVAFLVQTFLWDANPILRTDIHRFQMLSRLAYMVASGSLAQFPSCNHLIALEQSRNTCTAIRGLSFSI